MAYEKKLIEGNFPCQQVGAETKRERGASSALPPLYFLHVWWARRPLTPSRAALLGSILPADTDPNLFLKELGIVKKQAVIGDQRWTLVGKILNYVETENGREFLRYTDTIAKLLDKEKNRRQVVRDNLERLSLAYPEIANELVFASWLKDNEALPDIKIPASDIIEVVTVVANPALVNERIAFKDSERVRSVLGDSFSISPEDMYGYGRAYETKTKQLPYKNVTILDPTAGGGSIPFEAMRLGCNVISNDLNPVASAIQKATLEYPNKYGVSLLEDITKYSNELVSRCGEHMSAFFPKQEDEQINDYLFCRYATCPSCGERAPLMNAYALHKKKDGWMVVPQIEGEKGFKKVRFIPTRLVNGKGPNGENPEVGTVHLGTGRCIFCGQAIESEEIKRQARGDSTFGTWSDELYCVVGVREQPKLDKNGNVQVYASGKDKGKVKTENVTFFREPTSRDLEALHAAEKALKDNWTRWDEMGLIPTERIPEGHKTHELHNVGIHRWCDMFTPRQLLGLLTAMETLQKMTPEILQVEGKEKGTAIVHYLQYMIDKCIDYNSRQTMWISQRGSIAHTFTRHDYSLKWAFAEMVFTGLASGLAWGRDQVLDAYKGICSLLGDKPKVNLRILNGSAANLDVQDKSADIICVDPPYYNNVQYAELSDYFYVWQKRIFKTLYPDLFSRRLTNKNDEAVANPVRDGGTKEAIKSYERLMSGIFAECRRVMKDDGVMTMMFTHKTQNAWETLTRALIENGWIITSTFPVESEYVKGIHQLDLAAAASSIFIVCRKRDMEEREPTVWSGFGGKGVSQELREAVRASLCDYEELHLNAVDEMVASYGSALRVLSENWPVMDGDELVTPIRAMREAGTVVAQHQMTKLTGGKLSVDDVKPEAGVVLTLLGIYGMNWFPFDDALSLSKSLNIRLEMKAAGYHDEGRMVGINDEKAGKARRDDEEEGFFAPVVKKGSKLRLAAPEERIGRRLDNPQNEWDVLQGLIMSYRSGDVPVARAYLQTHAEGNEDKIIGILKIWEDNCGSEELKKEARRLLFGLG